MMVYVLYQVNFMILLNLKKKTKRIKIILVVRIHFNNYSDILFISISIRNPLIVRILCMYYVSLSLNVYIDLINEVDYFSHLSASDSLDSDEYTVGVIVMPYYPCTLDTFIIECKKHIRPNNHHHHHHDLPSNFIFHLFKELILCCKELFICEYIHRDIKPSNIMLMNNDNLNVTNNTSSSSFSLSSSYYIHQLHTPSYHCVLLDYTCGSTLSNVQSTYELQHRKKMIKKKRDIGILDYGTCEYASIQAHQGYMASYAQELEAMA